MRPWTRQRTSGPTPSTFRHELQVQPDVHGPYEAPKTAADVADASDAAESVLDVLEAGNFVQTLLWVLLDVVGAGYGVLGGVSSLWMSRMYSNPCCFFDIKKINTRQEHNPCFNLLSRM